MGNILSVKRHVKLDVKNLKETGFDNFTEVSSIKRDARIKEVTDESIGKASNLLKEDVDRTLISYDSEENTHGWLTKRHELCASVLVELCNHTKVYGFDIDTTGYINCCPYNASIVGYRCSDDTWQTIVPLVKIEPDTHNFFQIYNSDTFSCVRLSTTPAGGISRFRTYGQIIPDWSDKDKEYNLASASLGASIVRWTDLRNANNDNILLDHGIKMSDGWLSPRSPIGKDLNDLLLIQLATPGKLSCITIDTTGFDCNSPTSVFIQGCYSKDTDPNYDGYSSWIRLVNRSPVVPGGVTLFDVSGVTDEVISHIQLYIIPDGGIQQVKVFGMPAEKNNKKGRLLLGQASQPKAIENSKPTPDQVSIIAVDDRPVIEQFNVLPTVHNSTAYTTSTPSSIDGHTSSNDTLVINSEEVKIEEIDIDNIHPPAVSSPPPSNYLRKRKSTSVELSDTIEDVPTKKQRGGRRKTK